MMEERFSIFDFIKNVFKIYGFTVLVFIAFAKLIGNLAMGNSTMFSLGDTGLAIDTLLQLLLFIICEVALEFFVFKSRVLKITSVVLRTIIFLIATVLLVAGYAVWFGWFPANEPGAWIGFIISFSVCLLLSSIFTWLEEKNENKKMKDALNRMQNKEI